MKTSVTKELLTELYVNQDLERKQVAEHFGITERAVSKHIKKHNLFKKPRSKQNISKEEYQECVNNGLSNEQIAEHFQISISVVEYNLYKYRILRTPKEKAITKDVLVEQYVTLKKPKHEVAKFFNVSSSTISNYIREYGIHKGHEKKFDVTRDVLFDLYINQNFTDEQIGEMYGVSRKAVSYARKKHNIEKDQSAVIESTRTTHIERRGVSHPLKDKQTAQRVAKKRLLTMKGDNWGRDSINAELHNRQIEMIGEFETTRTKTMFRCLKEDCGCAWRVRPFDVLSGHGCPKCAKRLKYTSESFREYLKQFPMVELLGDFESITKPASFRCKVCDYGANGEWKIKPMNFTCATSTKHICKRCHGKEPVSKEKFIERLNDVNPNIIVVEYESTSKPAVFRCLLDGHEWRIAGAGSVIQKGFKRDGSPRRTGCPACKGYFYNGIVYDSSWELLFHIENPHLTRVNAFDTKHLITYVLDGERHKWFPDFYDPETNVYYEVKPDDDPYENRARTKGKTKAKRALDAKVIWIGDEEAAVLRKKHPDFNPDLYRQLQTNLHAVEAFKSEFAALFPSVSYNEVCLGMFDIPEHRVVIYFDTNTDLPQVVHNKRARFCKKKGLHLFQIWASGWDELDVKLRLTRHLERLFTRLNLGVSSLLQR